MDSLIKLLKVVFLLVGITAGLALLGVIIFLFTLLKEAKDNGVNLETVVKQKAVEQFIDPQKLTPTQQDMLEEGDVDGLVQDLQQNVTPAQIDCAVEAVGESRARELLETKNPTPQELLKLSDCL